MIILSNGSIIKLSNGSWLNVQETQNIPEPTSIETPAEEDAIIKDVLMNQSI